MFGLGRRHFLDEDLEAWCLDTWAWLMRNLGGMERLARTPLITPSRDFFPPTEFEGEARAEYIFNCVKRWMGMADWWCELHAFDRPTRPEAGPLWAVQHGRQANGTFQVANGQVRIRYARDLIDKPIDLVGVFAHELAHYRLATVAEPSPAGEEAHELETDLTVAFLGFGVFAANRAFSFERHSQGWQTQRNGYLSERTWAFALALFLALKQDGGDIKRWLKPSLASDVARAGRYLEKKVALVDDLRSIVQAPAP